MVNRCADCGAPLTIAADSFSATCAYCGAENELMASDSETAQAMSVRLAGIAKASEDSAAKDQARSEQLLNKYQSLMAKAVTTKDAEAGKAALVAFESYLRLAYAPTLRLYNAMAPNDPIRIQGLVQIDAAIDTAVSNLATRTLHVDYTPVAKRV